MAIVCKKCFDEKIGLWKKTFVENVTDPETLPDFNEEGQHYSPLDMNELASKLNNGEMIEVICAICKRTHLGKDSNGNVKERFVGGNWEDFIN